MSIDIFTQKYWYIFLFWLSRSLNSEKIHAVVLNVVCSLSSSVITQLIVFYRSIILVLSIFCPEILFSYFDCLTFEPWKDCAVVLNVVCIFSSSVITQLIVFYRWIILGTLGRSYSFNLYFCLCFSIFYLILRCWYFLKFSVHFAYRFLFSDKNNHFLHYLFSFQGFEISLPLFYNYINTYVLLTRYEFKIEVLNCFLSLFYKFAKSTIASV